MAAFELFRDGDGDWRFRLRADNGEPVLQSEAYESREAALDGIDVIRRLAASSPTEDLTG